MFSTPWRSWPAFVVAILLAGIDGVARLTFTGRQHVGHAPLAYFNAAAEWTIPTWFSVLSMAAAGIGCLRQGAMARGWWCLMGTLFCYLAIDDLFALHEGFGALLYPWLGGYGVYVWVFTLGPIFAILGLACAARTWSSLAGEPARRSCLLAGFGALGIAIGFEAIEETVLSSGWRPRGIPLIAWTQWCEESLEMLGPALLLAASWPRSPAAPGVGPPAAAARP